MPEFLDWTMKAVVVDKARSMSDPRSEVTRSGALKALAAVHKQGKRDDLLKYSDQLLELVVKQELKKHHNVLLRKLSLKVIQRIGLTFLKAKVASWRWVQNRANYILFDFQSFFPPGIKEAAVRWP